MRFARENGHCSHGNSRGFGFRNRFYGAAASATRWNEIREDGLSSPCGRTPQRLETPSRMRERNNDTPWTKCLRPLPMGCDDGNGKLPIRVAPRSLRPRSHEIQKTRPCIVVSPDELNRHIRAVIVAPMTTRGRPYPTRVPIRFQRKDGQIVLDQIRTIDETRLVRRLGKISATAAQRVLVVLGEMFAP